MPRPYNNPPERYDVKTLLLLTLTFGLLLSGCATHLQNMVSVRDPLIANDVPSAVDNFKKKKVKKDDLLWLLEKAHLAHLGGEWTESNLYFELAERKADELYTKSVSKAALSLISSDKVLPYSSPLFEMTLIPYYRAINYLRLEQPEEALVEARKSSFALSHLSEKAADGNRRPLAFLNYVAGLLYASVGQWENAYLSYRLARQQYALVPAAAPPPSLDADCYLAARKLGRTSEMADPVARDPALPSRADAEGRRNVILFVESGFVPFRDQETITLPLMEPEKDENAEHLTRRYVDRYGNTYTQYEHSRVTLKQILQFAFPVLRDAPQASVSCEAGWSGGTLRRAQPALNLVPAVHEQFERETPGTFLKTVLRAVTKELARHQAAKSGGHALGWAVNILNIGTEQADTRSWLLLPRRYEILKFSVPVGAPQTLLVRTLDAQGYAVEEKQLPVTVKAGEMKWLSVRFFK